MGKKLKVKRHRLSRTSPRRQGSQPAIPKAETPKVAPDALLIDVIAQTRGNRERIPRSIPYLKHIEKCVQAVPSAERFVLDAEGSQHFGEIMRANPEFIARNHEFARAPYPVTWIELDAKALYRGVTGKEPGPNADDKIGYMIIGNSAYWWTYDPLVREARMMPIELELHRPFSDAEQLEFATVLGTSRLGLVALIWGDVLRKWVGPYWDKSNEALVQEAKSLRDQHTCRWLIPGKSVDDPSMPFTALTAGELRSIIAILLYLNQQKVMTPIKHHEAAKHFSRGKLRQYLSHSVVTISLEAKERQARARSAIFIRSPARRHDVRGCYCHDASAQAGNAAHCPHEWSLIKTNHWQCGKCGGKRWWRSAHMRGDASLGYVAKDYKLS